MYLVRHAQALGNLERRFQGRTDNPLTDLGRSQARIVARRFKALPVHYVYSSPLQRARFTASEIAGMRGLPVLVEPRLIEIHGGDMEDKPFEALKTDYPEQFRSFIEEPHRYTPVGGGESYQEVYDRVRSLMDDLLLQHEGKILVLVTHGCALQCMLSYAMGRTVDRMGDIAWGGNTAVSHILFRGNGSARIAYIGDSSHLPDRKLS